jgi:hypothetical protein
MVFLEEAYEIFLASFEAPDTYHPWGRPSEATSFVRSIYLALVYTASFLADRAYHLPGKTDAAHS